MSSFQQVKAVGALVALAAIAACGASSSGAAPRPNPISSEVPGPTTQPTLSATTAPPSPSATASGRFRQAYANAFEDFWVAYAEADQDADPNSSDLSRVATGAALVWARMQIEDHIKLGVTHRGGAAFRSVGADQVTETSALIGQCMDWSTWPVVNRRTGAVLQRFASYSQLVDSRMVLAGGQWRVATVSVRDVAC